MAAYSITSRLITSLCDLKPGDHIKKDMGIYSHHMIVVGVVNSYTITVIHKSKELGTVVEEDYAPDQIILLDYPTPYSGEEIIKRARQLISGGYNLFLANCEHFVTEVRTGTPISHQVDMAIMSIGVIGVIVVTAVIAYVGRALIAAIKIGSKIMAYIPVPLYPIKNVQTKISLKAGQRNRNT